MKEKILKAYSVHIYEIDSYFYQNYKEKTKVGKNGYECILFRIDVYFTKYFLVAETDKQIHEGRKLLFEEKKIRAIRKKNWL